MELLLGIILTLGGIWMGSQLGEIFLLYRDCSRGDITDRVLRIQLFRRSEDGRELLKSCNKEQWAIDPTTYDVKDLLHWKDMLEIEAIMKRGNHG
jgi:hypothetical protein